MTRRSPAACAPACRSRRLSTPGRGIDGRHAAMTPVVPLKTWIAIVGSTIGTFMAIINIQIVGASIGDIQGASGAGVDDGAWITPAYLVAEIVTIPLTAWLSRVFST